MSVRFIDPNSGAYPQPGGVASGAVPAAPPAQPAVTPDTQGPPAAEPVSPDPDAQAAQRAATERELAGMKKDELLERAERDGVEVDPSMTKAELITALLEQQD